MYACLISLVFLCVSCVFHHLLFFWFDFAFTSLVLSIQTVFLCLSLALSVFIVIYLKMKSFLFIYKSNRHRLKPLYKTHYIQFILYNRITLLVYRILFLRTQCTNIYINDFICKPCMTSVITVHVMEVER